MDRKIIVLQGPPACGKSTLAREIYNSDKEKYVIVNRDAIRDSRGEYWVPSQESYISVLEETAVRAALDHDLIPIIDATNLNPKTLDKWNKIAEEYQATIDLKLVYVPFKEALERDQQRERSVGKTTLESFYMRYFKKEFEDEMYTEHIIIKEDSESLPEAVIFDLDGTVALHTGRNPFDFSRIMEDVPDIRMVKMIRSFIGNKSIIFLTGREEKARDLTNQWIKKYIGEDFEYTLLMRKNGDRRHGDIQKQECYEQNVKDKYHVFAVYEDSKKCVDMWRNQGLLCCQVEDFGY